MKLINKYPDGSSYADISKIDNIVITKRINTYEDLWHLAQIIEAINYQGYTPVIKIPNLIDAQADRRFSNYQSFGLKLVAKFLNSFKARYHIFHPHNPEVVEALFDNIIIIDNSEFIKKVIYSLPVYTDLILMSADAGGYKSLMKLADKINWEGKTLSASKSRIYKDGKSILTQILPSFDLNKDILIVDDISVYGGTFKGLSKLLKEIGHKGKLYLAVSHITIQNLGEDPVTNYFDKVFTTNSKFDEYYYTFREEKIKPQNLEIIKMFDYVW